MVAFQRLQSSKSVAKSGGLVKQNQSSSECLITYTSFCRKRDANVGVMMAKVREIGNFGKNEYSLILSQSLDNGMRGRKEKDRRVGRVS